MPEENNLYEQLLAQGFSKKEIHRLLHRFILHEIACEKAYKQLSFTGKLKWHIQNSLRGSTFCQLVKDLTSKGLFMLKTQFAKKPKNPV